ncbi:MAG: hypothetical protein AAF528_08300 [Cyanobacteria bacterium P01_C01_bin.121]
MKTTETDQNPARNPGVHDDPDLKQRLVSALKAGFEEALEQLVEAPLAKITVKNFKGHIETS